MIEVDLALKYLARAGHAVALTGAGISTEAGIPDFRSPNGIWADESLMNLLSASGFRRDPAAFYRIGIKLAAAMRRALPTPAHFLLAGLEKRNTLDAVITQNIDGLHQAAGSRTVYELHGTYRTGHCVRCGSRRDLAALYDEVESGSTPVPECLDCGAAIKPDIVLFEDLLPSDAWEGARKAASMCDLMLVMGSSLVVYPAAGLPEVALAHGASLIIVNREETDYDSRAAAVVRTKLGDFARAAGVAFSIGLS